MAEAIRRVQDYVRGKDLGLIRASVLAPVIWPGATFITAQGAGAAASRILKVMGDCGLARWTVDGDDWGWVILDKPDPDDCEFDRTRDN